MTTRHLFGAFALCVAVTALFNIYLSCTLDSLPRLIIHNLRQQSKIDMLFVGNSLMNRALDEPTFHASWPGPAVPPVLFNSSIPATCPVEHYLMAREAFRIHSSIKYLVYDSYDRQLTETSPAGWDQLVGPRAMSYYIEPDIAKKLYFPDSRFDQLCFRLISFVPMLRERFSLWYHVENLRSRMEQAGMPPINKKKGLVLNFHELGYPDKIRFNQACEDVVRESSGFVPAVENLFRLAKGNGAKVFVIDMPMQANHRRFYYSSPEWIRYRDYIKQKLNSSDITYIDASAWVPDSVFLDDIHLNDDGAKIFSARLSVSLAKAISP